jgi:hypothetical protein
MASRVADKPEPESDRCEWCDGFGYTIECCGNLTRVGDCCGEPDRVECTHCWPVPS